MKKYLALVLAGLMLLFVSCGKSSSGGGSGNEKPTPSKTSVVGCWELVSVTTKVAVGSVNVNVYIDFKSTGSFDLYQKIGEGRYTKFTGTYKLDSDGKLSGTYDGGSAWGPYTAALSGTSLTLSTASETDKYNKINAIPGSVTSNLY